MILIAVALFAALSYAVTQSGRGSGSVDRERAMLAASSLVQTESRFQQAIMRLQLAYKCSETQLSFDNTVVTGYTNATAPSDKSCHIFDPAGAGLQFSPINVEYLDTSKAANTHYGYYYFTGNLTNYGFGSSTESELTLAIPYIKRDICLQINCNVGLGACNAEPLYSNSMYTFPSAKFTGTYSLHTTTGGGGSFLPPNIVHGCMKFNNYDYGASIGDVYVFFAVLIPR
jgi:hypothetical protein